jgi:hypothetical protein
MLEMSSSAVWHPTITEKELIFDDNAHCMMHPKAAECGPIH